MRRLLPYVAALALIVGVGLLVYGFKGGDFLTCVPSGRFTFCSGPDSAAVMAVGAMLLAAGVLGLWHR